MTTRISEKVHKVYIRTSCILLVLASSMIASAALADQQATTVEAESNTYAQLSDLKSFAGVNSILKKSWLDINGIAYHFDRSREHNERNWGLGLEVPTSDHTTWMIGTYKNSNWQRTDYLWYENTPWRLGPLQVGWMAGVATGYRSNPHSPMPVAGLAIVSRGKRIGVNVICLPPVVCAANVMLKVW